MTAHKPIAATWHRMQVPGLPHDAALVFGQATCAAGDPHGHSYACTPFFVPRRPGVERRLPQHPRVAHEVRAAGHSKEKTILRRSECHCEFRYFKAE